MQIFQLPVLLLSFVVYIQKLKNSYLTSYRLIVTQLKEASLPLSYLYFWPTSTSKLLWKQARICPARSRPGYSSSWSPENITAEVRETLLHPDLFFTFFYQVSSLGEERCQEPVTDRHNFLPPPSPHSPTSQIHTHTVSIVGPFRWLLLRRLLLLCLTASNKEPNVFASRDMVEKERGTYPGCTSNTYSLTTACVNPCRDGKSVSIRL